MPVSTARVGSGSAEHDILGPVANTPESIPLYTVRGWRQLHPVTRRLMEARALRSVAQGALVVDFVLYLRALHWPATAIGILLTASGLAGAGLALLSGPASDRLGRRRFLLVYQGLVAAGTLALLVAPVPAVIITTAVALGLGRGANGAAGPFAPVEQAWLAQGVPAADRGRVFSMNGAITFWGMGLGSLLGGTAPLFAGLLHGPADYMPLFALNLAVAAANYLQIAGLRETRPGAEERDRRTRTQAVRAAPGAEVDDESALRRRENTALVLLTLVNSVNSLGIGIFSPLLPLWFAVRFGAGPAAIGPIYGLAFVLTGVSSIATGELADRVGLVASVAAIRLLGVVLLVALPLMPSFGWAAVLYVARSVVNRGSAGARQAFGLGLVRDARRGLASSLNSVSQRLPSSVGPAIGGWLMEEGSLSLPFFVAAALQLAYVVLFATVLGRFEPGRRGAAAAQG